MFCLRSSSFSSSWPMASFVEDCRPQSEYCKNWPLTTSSNVLFDLRKVIKWMKYFPQSSWAFESRLLLVATLLSFRDIRERGVRPLPHRPSTVLGRLRPRPCEEKVNLYVDLRSGLGQFSSGQDIDLRRSCCISFNSAAHCEQHIGAFSYSLAQFDRVDRELLLKLL